MDLFPPAAHARMYASVYLLCVRPCACARGARRMCALSSVPRGIIENRGETARRNFPSIDKPGPVIFLNPLHASISCPNLLNYNRVVFNVPIDPTGAPAETFFPRLSFSASDNNRPSFNTGAVSRNIVTTGLSAMLLYSTSARLYTRSA